MPASVRAPANHVDVGAAFEAAIGGSLCVRRRRPPHQFSLLVAKLRRSDNVRYICLDEDSLQCLVRPGSIEIPPQPADRHRRLMCQRQQHGAPP
jgi:hypothetical protein